MNIINCKKCNKIFQSSANKVCPACHDMLEKLLMDIRQYIDENPLAGISQMAEATNTDEKLVLQFIREGRLELNREGLGLPCERCGARIHSGRMCSDCLREFENGMKKGLSSAAEASYTKDKPSGRMFVANRYKRND